MAVTAISRFSLYNCVIPIFLPSMPAIFHIPTI
jgi:hypothetical protein